MEVQLAERIYNETHGGGDQGSEEEAQDKDEETLLDPDGAERLGASGLDKGPDEHAEAKESRDGLLRDAWVSIVVKRVSDQGQITHSSGSDGTTDGERITQVERSARQGVLGEVLLVMTAAKENTACESDQRNGPRERPAATTRAAGENVLAQRPGSETNLGDAECRSEQEEGDAMDVEASASDSQQ
jgi:hypothetical protein